MTTYLMKLSIILPVYNESGSLDELYKEIKKSLEGAPFEYEIIAVNDGSKDASKKVLENLATGESNLKVINFNKNYGQTAAIHAGIEHATGDVLVPMDSDLENSPADIPFLLKKINEGYDVVSGWRQGRWKGNFFTRRLPSILANKLISAITGVKLHDYGCTLKAYRREVIQGTPLYGEMHRFIPAYASWQGARITEILVRYQPRKHGKSNYGLSRTFKVLLDLVVIKFLSKYMKKPMHFFGGFGFISLVLGFFSGATALLLRIFNDVHFIRTPLPLLTVFLIMMGVLFILMGILAEMLTRIYHEPQGKAAYSVENKVNFGNEPQS